MSNILMQRRRALIGVKKDGPPSGTIIHRYDFTQSLNDLVGSSDATLAANYTSIDSDGGLVSGNQGGINFSPTLTIPNNVRIDIIFGQTTKNFSYNGWLLTLERTGGRDLIGFNSSGNWVYSSGSYSGNIPGNGNEFSNARMSIIIRADKSITVFKNNELFMQGTRGTYAPTSVSIGNSRNNESYYNMLIKQFIVYAL